MSAPASLGRGGRATIMACTTGVVVLLLASVGAGQSLECPVGDHECLQQRFITACHNRSGGADRDTCSAWLEVLRQRPEAGDPAIVRMIGFTYAALGNLTTSTSGDRRMYLERAAAIFRARVAEDPTDVAALHWLRSYNTTVEERLEYLGRIASAAPEDVHALQAFASTPVIRPGLTMFDVPLVRNGIEIQMRAYRDVPHLDDESRLRLAHGIISAYEDLIPSLAEFGEDAAGIADAEMQLAEFIVTARADLGLDASLAIVNQLPAENPEQTLAALESLCDRHVMEAFAAAYCTASVAAVVDAATAAERDVGMQLADAVGSVLISMAEPTPQLDVAVPGWREQLAEHLETLMSAELDTVSVHLARANFRPDPDERFAALRQGAARFPRDGEIAWALAMEYLWRERREEAIAPLRVALDGLPEHRRRTVSLTLRLAQGENVTPAAYE